jgi:hypothetical protein
MSKLERVLVPGSTELPDCRCGQEMRLTGTHAAGPDAELRRFRCDACGYEVRLTVWTQQPNDIHRRSGAAI